MDYKAKKAEAERSFEALGDTVKNGTMGLDGLAIAGLGYNLKLIRLLLEDRRERELAVNNDPLAAVEPMLVKAEPGCVVVIKTPGDLSAAAVQNLERNIKRAFPAASSSIVLTGGIDLNIINKEARTDG